jgi:hypothetical protein
MMIEETSTTGTTVYPLQANQLPRELGLPVPVSLLPRGSHWLHRYRYVRHITEPGPGDADAVFC